MRRNHCHGQQHVASTIALVMLLACALTGCGSSGGTGARPRIFAHADAHAGPGIWRRPRVPQRRGRESRTTRRAGDGHALRRQPHEHGARWGCHRSAPALWTPLGGSRHAGRRSATAFTRRLRLALQRHVHLALERAAGGDDQSHVYGQGPVSGWSALPAVCPGRPFYDHSQVSFLPLGAHVSSIGARQVTAFLHSCCRGSRVLEVAGLSINCSRLQVALLVPAAGGQYVAP